MSGTRVDTWIWAIRLAKTRTAAGDLCRQGAVRINGTTAKPSKTIEPGDTVTVRRRGVVTTVEVVDTPTKRVGASVAAEAYIDHTPPPEAPDPRLRNQPTAVRTPGSGRPTKRERRRLDRFIDGQ